MSTPMKTRQSTKDYWDLLELAANLLRESEAVLVGAGAGLSASGGLRYDDADRAKALFPAHYACGLGSVMAMLSAFWTITPKNATAYWALWSRHIYETAYRTPALQPYTRLFDCLGGKNSFIISTNVDGQFVKAGFPPDRLFEPQGRYTLFQCSRPCSQEVYDNREMVETMLAAMPTPLRIRQEDVPRCPRCGDLLMPNLRMDERFVEEPHMRRYPAYTSFIERFSRRKLLLLELGVGFNSPGVIRYPFDNMVGSFPESHLIRINLTDAHTPAAGRRGVGIQADVNAALGDLLQGRSDCKSV